MKKKISFLIACYNELNNVAPLSKRIIEIMESELEQYDYEIIFIDNHSEDGTRIVLEKLCSENKKIKAIFNARNFGQMRSPVYGLKQTTGDCTIKLVADFQDPPELIPQLVKAWEEGKKIVIGVKKSAKESGFMYFARSCYYCMIKKISEIDHIEHFTGFGLYDKAFIEVLQKLQDPLPYLRGIVAELGFDYTTIPYEQPKRKSGKSKNNWASLYDFGMLGICSYSKVPLRMATLCGFIIAALSVIVSIVYFVLKLLYWNSFKAGIAPLIIGVFFLGALQLLFIGLLGEYIANINIRVMNRPLVVEEKRINFENEQTEDNV